MENYLAQAKACALTLKEAAAKAAADKAAADAAARAEKTKIYDELYKAVKQFDQCPLVNGGRIVVSNPLAISYLISVEKQDSMGTASILVELEILNDKNIAIKGGAWSMCFKDVKTHDLVKRTNPNNSYLPIIYSSVKGFMKAFVDVVAREIKI